MHTAQISKIVQTIISKVNTNKILSGKNEKEKGKEEAGKRGSPSLLVT